MRLSAPNPVRLVRPRRPAIVNICPVCGRPVTEHDERSRLRGTTYAHRACGSYQVRRVGSMGGYRAIPDGDGATRNLAE